MRVPSRRCRWRRRKSTSGASASIAIDPSGGNRGREVAIVGGGIGGLTAALAFAKRGARVTVLERSRASAEAGAGIQLTPNGHLVLNALGVGPALEAAGDPAQACVLRDGRRGRDLARWAPPRPWRMLHRADLVHVLEQACNRAGVDVRRGTTVIDVEATPRRPVLTLPEGGSLTPDLAIGADGIRSEVRAVLNGPDAPVFLKQSAWRALVRPSGTAPPEPVIHLFPGRHVVTYPVREGAYVNIVAVQDTSAWTEEGWSVPDDPETLRAAFPDAAPALADLLALVTETRRWGLFGRPVAPSLGASAIALVGDAAHPTLPFLAQGANLAIEDAWVLAAETDAPVSLDRALRHYARRRRPRVTRAVAAARGNGRLYHLGGIAGLGAHMGLAAAGLVAAPLLKRRYAWLHEHDVTAGEAFPLEDDAQLLARGL